MRGSITRKNDGRRLPWFGIVEVPRDPETGRRRQRWLGGFKTRREAQAALTATLQELATGSYVQPSKVTVAEFLEGWLRGLDLRPSTLDLYSTITRAYVVPRIGSIRLQDLAAGHLKAMYRQLRERGSREGEPLAPKTVANVHRLIRRALSDAFEEGLIQRNPAALKTVSAGARAGRGRDMRTWSASELAAFLEEARGERLFGAFLLAATTGMRRGEVLGLSHDAVFLEERRVQVRQALVLVGSRPELSPTKTEAGSRMVPIPAETVAALREVRKRSLEERIEWGEAYQETGLVFTREDGWLVHPERFADVFHRIAKRAGLPRIRVHDLRHTWATLALQVGVPAKVVSEILGHRSISITLDVYSHAIPAMSEDAAAKVAELVFGGRR